MAKQQKLKNIIAQQQQAEAAPQREREPVRAILASDVRCPSCQVVLENDSLSGNLVCAFAPCPDHLKRWKLPTVMLEPV
jgi:hypothetical protein